MGCGIHCAEVGIIRRHERPDVRIEFCELNVRPLVQVIEKRQRAKQPDWTFGETYSGQAPADRLDQRLEEATAR